MAIRALLLLVSVLLTGTASSAFAARTGPTQQVQATVNGILAILRDKQLDWYSKQVSIEAIIDRNSIFRPYPRAYWRPIGRRRPPRSASASWSFSPSICSTRTRTR